MTNQIPQLTYEQRQQLLIASIRDYAIYLLDPDGNVSSWNAGAERFKGYTADEIVGQHFSRFHIPEDQARGVPAQALATARTEGKFECEGWRVRKDGSRFWASVVIDPVFDGDRTDRLCQDHARHHRTEEGARRAARQRTALPPAGAGRGRLRDLHAVPERRGIELERRRANASRATWPRKWSARTSRASTPSRTARPACRPRALATAARDGKYEAEGWRVRKDGSRFWAHVVVDAIRDESGTLLGFAKITRDVTEQRAAAQSLEQTRAALFQSQKMEAIGQLTGGIAHDFNNLLSVVASGLEIIKVQGAGTDGKVIDSMNRAIERGASLTQQLLAFARQQPLAPAIHNINRLVEGFESVLRRAVDSTVDFGIALAPGLRNTCIDEARF